MCKLIYGSVRGIGSACYRTGLLLFLLIGVSGLIPAIAHFDQFMTVIAGLEVAIIESPWILLPLYGLLLTHVALHEFAHGVTCKHYGGSVPRLGNLAYRKIKNIRYREYILQ